MIKFYTVLPDNDALGGARQATKVSILLQEIGEEFETIDLDRKNFVRPRDSDFRKLNPNGRVPVIDDNGLVLWEAGAILHYIASTRPAARKFLPDDPHERARVMQWLFWEGTTLTPDLISAVTLLATQAEEAITTSDLEAMVLAAGGAPYLMMGASKDKEKQAWNQAVNMLHWDLQVMDQALSGRQYFGVDQLSLADIALGVVSSITFLMGESVKGHPNVRDWLLRLAKRNSFMTTPSFQSQMTIAARDGLI